MGVGLQIIGKSVVLRVIRGPIVLGHARALAGETVRVSAVVAQQALAERPGWVEVLGDEADLPATAAQLDLSKPDEAAAELATTESAEPPTVSGRKGSRK